jgi:cysteinyl-tRNA synthetase
LFEPIEASEVKIYVCGPTVYDHAHLGHARSSVVFDLLRRVLNYKKYKVKFVKNFTDIDDKIIDRMQKEKATLTEITEKYILSYLRDMEALNVIRADIEPKATENISEIITLIRNLLKKDIAYIVSNGDIYFDTSKDEKYMSISNKNIDENSQVSRLENSQTEKRNHSDFVVWKSAKESDLIFFEEIENSDEVKIAKGRPGWHIECSAMIDKHLTDKNIKSDFSIDIHGGGADLLFPHHENEASQSRCANGQELAKYWIHNGFVKINGEKMSKSLGNSFFVKDALEHYHGELLRFYLLSVHYRQDFNFSEEDLLQSKKRLDKIYRLKKRLGNITSDEFNNDFESKLLDSLYDDLNASKALAVIDEMVTSANESLDQNSKNKKLKKEIAGNIKLISDLIGVANLNSFNYFQFGVSFEEREQIEQLIEKRKVAKKEKNFQKADEIREKLTNLNISIMDTQDGTFWEKI